MAGAAPPARSASQRDSQAYTGAFVPDTLTGWVRVSHGCVLFAFLGCSYGVPGAWPVLTPSGLS